MQLLCFTSELREDDKPGSDSHRDRLWTSTSSSSPSLSSGWLAPTGSDADRLARTTLCGERESDLATTNTSFSVARTTLCGGERKLPCNNPHLVQGVIEILYFAQLSCETVHSVTKPAKLSTVPSRKSWRGRGCCSNVCIIYVYSVRWVHQRPSTEKTQFAVLCSFAKIKQWTLQTRWIGGF
jgi:hypothetical protein